MQSTLNESDVWLVTVQFCNAKGRPKIQNRICECVRENENFEEDVAVQVYRYNLKFVSSAVVAAGIHLIRETELYIWLLSI